MMILMMRKKQVNKLVQNGKEPLEAIIANEKGMFPPETTLILVILL